MEFAKIATSPGPRVSLEGQQAQQPGWRLRLRCYRERRQAMEVTSKLVLIVEEGTDLGISNFDALCKCFDPEHAIQRIGCIDA